MPRLFVARSGHVKKIISVARPGEAPDLSHR